MLLLIFLKGFKASVIILQWLLHVQNCHVCLWCQGPKIDHFVKSGWNPCNAVPMSEWLTPERCNKQRMDTLGNVVVPRQACLGLAVIARMMAGDFF